VAKAVGGVPLFWGQWRRTVAMARQIVLHERDRLAGLQA
jgi:hypothetical protein